MSTKLFIAARGGRRSPWFGFGVSIAVSCALIMAFGRSASAQRVYPNKSIQLVVGFAPGGIADIIARLIGQRLDDSLGQTFVIENRGGAGGAVAAKLVTNADPDGYTLLITTSAVAVNAAASTQAVDPRKGLTPIALVASTPVIFTVRGQAAAKNLMEFVLAKKDKSFTYASAGIGTVEHLTAEYAFKAVPGLNATHVPFSSGMETYSAVLGQHVDMAITTGPPASAFLKDGRLRALAVASHKRIPTLPDAPTLGEIGFPDFESASWVALFGPPGLPKDVAQKLNAAVNAALNEPDVRDRLTKLGFQLHPGSQPQFVDYVQSEVGKWDNVVKKTGFTLD